MSEYIFTFGFGQPNAGCFHVIKAESRDIARTIMFERFGDKWAFQYDSRRAAGVEQFGLKEVK